MVRTLLRSPLQGRIFEGDIQEARCPFRVNRVTLTARRELLLFPDQRTSPTGCVGSEKCQERILRL